MSVDLFRDKLLPGEHIVWSGRPGQGILFAPRDIFLIPFSLFWGGFAAFWEYTAVSRAQTPLFMQLWGIPFVLVGLFLIVGRFLLDAHVRAHLFYAITDSRILILRTRPFAAFISLDRDQLPAVELTAGHNGTGTLSLAPPAPIGQYGRAGWVPALDPTPKLIAVDNAQRVLDLLLAPRPAADAGSLAAQPIALQRMADWPIPQSGRLSPRALRIVWIIPVVVVAWQVVWSTLVCSGSGAADVHAVRSFATTEASYNRGENTPVQKFGPNDTAMALVVLNWPNARGGAGSHRIDWNWYRDEKLVSTTKYCHMRFTDSPFTLRTWRTAGALGSGHIRVDTLIDGHVAGTTEFDVTSAPPAARQGALLSQPSCGELSKEGVLF